MSKPKTKKSGSPKAAPRPAVLIGKRPSTVVAFPAIPKVRGIRNIHVARGKKGPDAIVIQLAPHYLIVVTGGPKPTIGLSYTHHGFVAEAFELNGQLEQVINLVRQHLPQLSTD